MSVTDVKTDSDFTELLAQKGAILVDFFATWCGPCKAIAPHLLVISEQYPDIKFYKVDIDRCENTATTQKITSMPTFKLYVDGKVAKTVVGASIDKIRAALDEVYEIQGFVKPSARAPAAAATTTTTTGNTDAAKPAAAAAAPTPSANAGKVVQVETEQEFRSAIQQPAAVVDFFAEWCGPCKQLAPYFRTLAAQYPHVTFIKIDNDDFEEIGEEFNVASLPTLVFFKEGKKVHSHIGVSKEKIAAAFEEHYGKPQ